MRVARRLKGAGVFLAPGDLTDDAEQCQCHRQCIDTIPRRPIESDRRVSIPSVDQGISRSGDRLLQVTGTIVGVGWL